MIYSKQNGPGLTLKNLFPFELDRFQQEAIAALDAGKSVVVCAPTGSGKTLIGEYAIYRALSQGRRVFYTTPLKALSNQKLRDFKKQFGDEMVGLVTGDVSYHREAPILVMTTEIFRNMLYGTPIGEIGTSLEGVEAVVLDECHYMNDRQRGTVWEESIVYCPSGIQLLALSATVANSDRLTDWISKVHGPTELIYSDFRPVPLEYNFCNAKGLFPLLDTNQKKINPRLRPKNKQRQRGRQEEPPLTFILSKLQERDMLPAIYFIFSRRGCARAVETIARSSMTMVNDSEKSLLEKKIGEYLHRNPELSRNQQLEPLSRGIAAHHAGMLPAWKGLVEELFQQGLIKVVFATETLAAGINMPARTTVISSLSKRTDDGHRLLKPSEFLQMSGRAGRRGMDLQGYVVTVQTRFEGAKEASYLATSGADPLVSQFTPSYGMVLNLLQTHTMQEARELVERSFGQYLSSLSLVPKLEQSDRLKEEYIAVQAKLGLYEDADVRNLEDLLASYEKLKERLKEEKRLLKILEKQAEETRLKEILPAVSSASVGKVFGLKGKHIPTAKRANASPIPAVLVAQVPGPGQAPYFLCLGKDNRWYVAAAVDVVGLYSELPPITAVERLSLPEMDLRLGQCRKSDETTQAFAESIPELPPPPPKPELIQQKQKILEVEGELAAHPLNEWGSPRTLLKGWRRLLKLDAEITAYQAELDQYLARYWQEFLNLISILQVFSSVEEIRPEEIKPTVLGQACAAIRGDNELWLGLVLMSGTLDDLDPHHFAAACAALVTEVSRPDSWTNYELSVEVQEALRSLQNLRRRLFQVQRRYKVALPVWLEWDLISLVEQWALGVDWLDLVDNTSLDEGDVVRILRRTLDLLSQIPHVPYASSLIRQNANRARQLIDRFPVNEEVE